jgi:hypothetical protein
MLTDIAKTRGAEQGIAERVQQHVAIGVRDHTLRVRHTDAAEHHVIARPKGMHIKT